MSLIAPEMIDFSSLKTPPQHGDVLVMPAANQWIAAARENHERLAGARAGEVGLDLAAWRREARLAIAGNDDALIFVLGHQPEFIHPGVWAKHVAAMRAASACDGIAINLVVDSDAPKSTSLVVPTVSQGRVTPQKIPFSACEGGITYEQWHPPTSAELERAQSEVRAAMGGRFEKSQMPSYFEALTDAALGNDWVDRLVASRRAVESDLGVEVRDVRVSEAWYGPLLIDMLLRSQRFAECYNGALARYRRENRVRGSRRPIPDLHLDGSRVELPVWAMRSDEPRSRLFVETGQDVVRLLADSHVLAEIPLGELREGDASTRLVSLLGDWRLRPRALALTMWARLLLADLFIHGIGGAKYDRISDVIVADYYGLTPPHMACVSATLHLDLPSPRSDIAELRRRKNTLRDLRFNPQRNLPSDKELMPLWEQRSQEVHVSRGLRETDPGNRNARRRAFERIRNLNKEALALRPSAVIEREDDVRQAAQDLQQYEIVRNREYFFALYDRSRLETLLAALPSEGQFRV